MDFPISIIVPIYNAEHFLPQCIESILLQTLNKCEKKQTSKLHCISLHHKEIFMYVNKKTSLENVSRGYTANTDKTISPYSRLFSIIYRISRKIKII